MKIERAYHFNETAKRHIWILSDAESGVAVHLWIAGDGKTPYGGIESHSPKRPAHRTEPEPDHKHCWILDGPCWHDGTSSGAERAIEMYRNGWLDNETAWQYLVSWLASAVGNAQEVTT